MAVIEKFLGKRVEVPEHLRYHVKQGLWARCDENQIVFGFTQPALVLLGGIKDMEWLVENVTIVTPGESIIFAITGKILYMVAPLGGTIQYNDALNDQLALIDADPYGGGWLFRIKPQNDIDEAYRSLATYEVYLKSLQATEGFKNPEGIKGGVSGICKAVYSGIGEQKL